MEGSRPWWLWPNLLAFDAPVIAVVWQQFLAAEAGVQVPPIAAVVLGLVVWGVYLGDRWLDARRGNTATDRHRFAARYHRIFGPATVLVLAIALSFVPFLPNRYLLVGGITAVALLGYLAVVHAVRSRAVLPGVKEATVAVVFGAGVAVPLFADGFDRLPLWLPGVAAFAGLCGLNCLLISRWEEPPGIGPSLAAVILAAVGTMVCAVAARPPVRAAILLSVNFLMALHLVRCCVSNRGRRVLADAVLLTPLMFGFGL